MDERLAITRDLMDARIPFTVHYPGKDNKHAVFTINDPLNNEQLRVATDLGGSMGPNGVVQILCIVQES